MRLAIDVCVSLAVELELWRAGYKVPVRAQNGEPDERWLERAVAAACDAVITMDRGAASAANRHGMQAALVPAKVPAAQMPAVVLDAMEEMEERQRYSTGRWPAAILAPLVAVGLMLAACAPAPRPLVAPQPTPTPWCFAAVTLFEGRDQAAVGCFETEGLCGNAQRRALRWGGMAGVREVGRCNSVRGRLSSMNCPHCGTGVHEKWSVTDVARQNRQVSPTKVRPIDHIVESMTCPQCQEFILRYLAKSPSTTGVVAVSPAVVVFPKAVAVRVPNHVPPPFDKDLREAALVLDLSPKASAALSRRILQMVLVEQGGAKPNASLDQQIEQTKPSLPPYIVRTIDAVRVVGNFSAHPIKDKTTGEIQEVEDGEAELTLQAVIELLRFYFTEPGEADSVIKGIEAKLAAAGKPPLKLS